MLKALTPVATLITAFLLGLERPSFRVTGSVTLITLGVLAASQGEGRFNVVGACAGVVGGRGL